MKRAPLYPAFIVSLVIGFLLGTLSTSSPAFGIGGAGTVTGGTVTGCVGVTASTTGLNLGGRTITPSTILRVPNNQPCDPAETTLNLNSYANTVLVSATSPLSATNGTNLLNALNSITTASAANPYLLKIEPGIYFLGNNNLKMKPFVDVEGSGEGITIIGALGTTNQITGTIDLATNTELRSLTAVNYGGNNNALALSISSSNISATLTHVTGLASGGSNASIGFIMGGGVTTSTVSIKDSTLKANGTAANGGLVLVSSGTALVYNSTLVGSTNSAFTGGGATIKIADSGLLGPVPGAGIVCVASYNASTFAALSSTCT